MPLNNNDILVLKDIDEITTSPSIKQHHSTNEQSQTARKKPDILQIPNSLSLLISSCTFLFNLSAVKAQACNDSLPMLPNYFNGACLDDAYMNWNGDQINLTLLPAFNFGVRFGSQSFWILAKLTDLFGTPPYPARVPGQCGVALRGTCEYDPILANISAYQLANWSAPQNTVIQITGMGNLTDCNNQLLSCLSDGVRNILQNTPSPTSFNPTTPYATTTSPATTAPPKSSSNTFIYILSAMIAFSAIALTIGIVYYRRHMRQSNPDTEPLVSSKNRKTMAENLVHHSAILTVEEEHPPKQRGQATAFTPKLRE